MKTYSEAQDSLFSVIQDCINSESEALLGYVPAIVWPGTQPANPMPTEKIFVQVDRVTLSEEQSTLKGVNKRFTTSGLCTIMVYGPTGVAKSLQNCQSLAVLIRDAFRDDTTSGLWYRDAQVRESPIDGTSILARTLVNYEYDEIR